MNQVQEQAITLPSNVIPITHQQPLASESRTPDNCCECWEKFKDGCRKFFLAFPVLVFYQINVIKYVVFGWVAALGVSGIQTDQTKWMAYSLATCFGGLGVVLFASYMHTVGGRFNYWTAAVLAEASKERKRSKFMAGIYLSVFLILAVVDWNDCWSTGSTEGICEQRATLWSFGSAVALCGLTLVQILSYNGPFSEHIEVVHPVFYKLQMNMKMWKWCIPKVWYDSAGLISTLRIITHIIQSEDKPVAELKENPQFQDIDWDLIENMTDDDIKDLTLAVRAVKVVQREKEIMDFVKNQIDLLQLAPEAELSEDQQRTIIDYVVEKFLQSNKPTKKDINAFILPTMKRKTFESKVLTLWHITKIPHVLFGLVANVSLFACCLKQKKKTSVVPQTSESSGGNKNEDEETGKIENVNDKMTQ